MTAVAGLKSVWRKIFYRIDKAEHFRFETYNEFLITYWVVKVPFVRLGVSDCVSAIGNPTGYQFETEIEALEKKGVNVIRHELSRQEFDGIARNHQVLSEDSWVKMRLLALDSGVARSY